MIKYTTQQVDEAVAIHGENGRAIAAALGTSESHGYYILRTRRNRIAAAQAAAAQAVAAHIATQAAIAAQQAPAPMAALAPALVPALAPAPVAEAPAIVTEPGHRAIVRTHVDPAAFTPPIMADYKRRALDKMLELYSMQLHTPTIMVGEAGSGKTTAAEQLAARHKLPFLRIPCDNVSVYRDMLGRQGIADGSTFFKFGLMLEFMQIPSIILVDEFNSPASGASFFLHEALDRMQGGRRLFIKEADAVINIHADCRIILACNPNTSKYSGTNKVNSALADRCAVATAPAFTPKEVPAFFDCGNAALTESLGQFYQEARRMIDNESLRVVFSLRGCKRISESVKAGASMSDALYHNFLNHAYLTASQTERESLAHLAQTCFGTSIKIAEA